MLGDFKSINGKDLVYYTKAPFHGYLNSEGYERVEVCNYDISTKIKGYISMDFLDLERKVVKRANLRTKPMGSPDEELPLEKLIKLALESELEEDVYCFSVELDLLIGLECQILVERDADYYNIKDVFSKDEELGEYVSKSDLIKSRLPKGIFNSN
jgi:hypothetical protein